MRTAATVAALAVLFVVGAFAVPPRVAAGDLSGAHGGDLRVALQAFGGLDPTIASIADNRVLELAYDSLGRVDSATLAIVPWAATGWSWAGGADKNITVTLRGDLRFSDNTAYDADDVLYSLRQYKQGGVSRWDIVKVDDWTLRFDFTNVVANEAGPGLFFTQALTAKIAWKTGAGPTSFSYSGPFAVSSVSSTQVVLVPNTHHFRGGPNLNSITYVFPYTTDLDASGNSVSNDAACALMFHQVHLIGWPLLANDLTNTRDCTTFGGFPAGSRESLLSTDPNRTVRHVLTAKNAGPEFLYFGFAFNGGSLFVGAPGSEGQKLRSSVYAFVNKGNYRDVEPNSAITHGLVHAFDEPWAPPSCPPWTPCNVIMDTGFTGTGAAKRTNTDPGVQTLATNGFLDRNADGIRETSAGAPIAFTILAPAFSLDPRKTTIANDMQFLLSSAGLSVTVQQFTTWAALDAAVAGCTTSCMYVKRFSGATVLPDWLYTMPEIVAANDPAVNTHLGLGANTCYDTACRRLHVGHVSHLVGAAADVLPVLMFNTLEAYDFESFSGWVNMFGGINNFASLTGLRLPPTDADGDGRQDVLSARLSIFPRTSLQPGDTTTVEVQVRDAIGQAVTGATVELTESYGSFAMATGTTDGQGIFSTTYTADAVTATTDEWIGAEVTKATYTGTEVSGSLSIHAPPAPDLVVVVGRAQPVIDSGNSTLVLVTVEDASGNAVAGATVTLSTDLPGATIIDASGDATGTTDGSGTYTATFRSDSRQGVTYRVTATVSAAGYHEDTDATSIVVRENLGTVTPVDVTRNVPGFEALAAVGAIGLAAALVAVARRRREG